MVTVEQLLSIDKDNIPGASKDILKSDLPQLVEWLDEKNDKIRYQAFLLLLHRSEYTDEVYPYWDIFRKKLKSDNSYQRSIGIMLMGENIQWDREDKISDAIEDCLLLLKDDKPITVRQCIQSLCKIVRHDKRLHIKIANAVMALDLQKVRQSMQKLILYDILLVLAAIRIHGTTDEIEDYIFKALLGGILDKKTKNHVKEIMGL